MKKVLLISVICFIAISLFSSCSAISSYTGVIERNWGFDIPSDASLKAVYEKDEGASFHGDGLRYHVFEYENEEPIYEMCDWSETEQEAIFYSSLKKSANRWLKQLGVDKDYYPDFSRCVHCYQTQDDNSEMIIYWDDDKNMLYVIESFL